MRDKQVVVTREPSMAQKRQLWRAAIKWPLYSVAVMPVLLAAGWRFGAGQPVRCDQLLGFLLASILRVFSASSFFLRTPLVASCRAHFLHSVTFFFLLLSTIINFDI